MIRGQAARMRRSETSFTSFSHHTYERVEERLTMSRDELGDLLDHDLTLLLAEEKGSQRVHRLNPEKG